MTNSRFFRRAVTALSLLVLVIISSVVALLLVGNHHRELGPFPTGLRLVPSLSGGTVADLGPLGQVQLRTHQGPVGVQVDLFSMSPERAGRLVTQTVADNGRDELDVIIDDLGDALVFVVVRSALAAAVLSGVVSWLVYRRFRRSVQAVLISVLLSAGVITISYATLNGDAITEPNYRGLVAAVPSLVGDVEEIAGNFDRYRSQLGRLLANTTELYRTGLLLPDYQTDQSTVTFLHVSDLHLNPEGWDVIDLLVDRFAVAAVLDTGDITDHGSEAEDIYLEHIATVGVPYLYVRGNHDSAHTQAAIAAIANARVLDDASRTTVEGIVFAGMGDPRFTPDKTRVTAPDRQVLDAAGLLAGSLADGMVDVALFHDSTAVTPLAGQVGLVLAGHTHRYRAELIDPATLLLVGGSTGGGGLRALSGKQPAPLQATLIHINRKTGAVVAWDEITMGGLGLASVSLTRHLPNTVTAASQPDPIR